MNDENHALRVYPIGYISSSLQRKFDVPHQPDQSSPEVATIELLPNRGFEHALSDLEGFEIVWLLWWFHRNSTWRPKVRPPRGEGTKRGVFSTRAPHRPNPLGISAVRLLGVSGRSVTIGANDLVDGTPILDIKPYVPEVDSFPCSATGWLAEVSEYYARPPEFTVVLSDKAASQRKWLEERGIEFLPRAVAILERDPSVNRTRRIRRFRDALFQMGCGEWRLYFSLNCREVRIEYFTPGYRPENLLAPGREVIKYYQEQLDFYAEWILTEA